MKKHGRSDLALLKTPLLGTLAAFGLAGLVLWWSLLDGATAAQAYDAAVSRQQQREQRLLQLEREAPERQKLAAAFSRPQPSRPHQPENRLAWTETLEQIRRELHLIELHYQFGPQTKLNEMPKPPFSSPMTLQLRLRHEQELLDFFARLKQQAKALILVRHCKLSSDTDSASPGLTAACELAWVTSNPMSTVP